MNRKICYCDPRMPRGWFVQIVKRSCNKKSDTYFFPPCQTKLRSKQDVRKFIGGFLKCNHKRVNERELEDLNLPARHDLAEEDFLWTKSIDWGSIFEEQYMEEFCNGEMPQVKIVKQDVFKEDPNFGSDLPNESPRQGANKSVSTPALSSRGEEISETGSSGLASLNWSTDSVKLMIAQMENGEYPESETSFESSESSASFSAMSAPNLVEWFDVTEETETQTQSSRDLFKSSGGDNPGLRQRRDKEAMVSEYSNVTDSLTANSRQLAETVERSKRSPHNHYYKGCEKFYKRQQPSSLKSLMKKMKSGRGNPVRMAASSPAISLSPSFIDVDTTLAFRLLRAHTQNNMN